MSNIKICLDAGHYGNENKSTVVTPTYYEAQMAWKLHLMQREELEKYEGITVIQTRADQKKDLEVYQRGVCAKGCDLFISDHSNWCDTPSVDRAEVIYQISGKCKDLAETLAKKITEIMGTKDKHKIFCKKNSAGTADYYGVIRGAAAVGVPGLILEHSFHSNAAAAKWLQSEDNLRKLARAEAAIIAAYFGCKLKAAPHPHHPFVDVPADAWYAPYVQWAYENEITDGVDATHFDPNAPCTRAQMVTLLCRLAGKLGG